ncbi:MAG: hypothetical protein KAJ19_14900 [Gammaproteobacteria bacterium]|nr:hypothetical protein [Gammaproteobacteria bacterium]
MRIIAILIAVLLLAGCGTTIMQHPTKASIDDDNYQCGMEAEQRAAAWGGSYGANPFLYKDFFFECLERRGWRKVKQ